MKDIVKALRYLLFIIITSININNAFSQLQPQFSNYHHVLSYVNPAAAGIYDGDLAISTAIRQQWGGIFGIGGSGSSPTTFSTKYLGLDYAVYGVGLNVQFLQDNSGYNDAAQIKTRSVATSFSYLVRLGSRAAADVWDLQMGARISSTSVRLEGDIVLIDDFLSGGGSAISVADANYTNIDAGAILMSNNFLFGISFFDMIAIRNSSQLLGSSETSNPLNNYSIQAQYAIDRLQNVRFILRGNLRKSGTSIQTEFGIAYPFAKNTFFAQLGYRARPKIGRNDRFPTRDAVLTTLGMNLGENITKKFFPNSRLSLVYTRDWTISTLDSQSPNDSDEISLVWRFTGDHERMRQANNIHYKTRQYRNRKGSRNHIADVTKCFDVNVDRKRYENINSNAIEKATGEAQPNRRIANKKRKKLNKKAAKGAKRNKKRKQ